MGYQKFQNRGGAVRIDLGDLNPKQKLFCQSRSRYTAYGGARGGGKTHVLRIKAFGGALTYPGIRILIVRKEYPELEQNIILPMRKLIPPELAAYNGTMRMMFFANGSVIKFGHYGPNDDDEYQGVEYDWIFMEEATQFSERQFRTLGACLRGATKVPRRMYLTCNPGGIGHMWVKRLFVDREYRDGEKPEDYTFIPATVDDNPQLLEASPEYKQMLDLCRRTCGGPGAMATGTPWLGPSSRSSAGRPMWSRPFGASPGSGGSTGSLTMAWICSPAFGSRWTTTGGPMYTGRSSKAG